MFQIGDWRVLMAYLGLLSDLLCKAHIMSPEIYLTRGGGRRNGFSPPPEMFWRHPKMSSSTPNGDVSPKNVWLPPKDRLGPPENVLAPPKDVLLHPKM